MAKLIFSQQEINAYLKAIPDIPIYSGDKYTEDIQEDRKGYNALHCYYMQTLRIAEKMKVHADGFFPYKLIRERRPNETLEVLAYRETIFVAKTMPTFTKVLNSLQKIRRSSDWVIKYDDEWESKFARVTPTETLEKYCDYHLPYFKSVTNWAFSYLLRKYLIDPNAVCFVKPLTMEMGKTDYLQPIPEIFDSLNVMDFIEDDYAILLNPYGATYTNGHGKPEVGGSMYVITTEKIMRYDQINLKKEYELILDWPHGLGQLPVFKLKGNMIGQSERYFLYESRIGGMIPELDEAVREYSDLQAARVLHIYPERWEYTNTACVTCKGMGVTAGSNGAGEVKCHSCGGSGYTVAGPYSKMVITPNKTTDGVTGNIPSPPAGFIEKDVEIVKLQNESVQQHLYDALAAINFDFLADVPLSQSGTAKQYDRNESNNTTHAVAEDIVAILDQFYELCALYRYSSQYSAEEIEDMLPTIPVPENFDLYSIANAQKELNDAKTASVNPLIINALEQDFTNKRFVADHEIKDNLGLVLKLDPLAGISEDDKMSRLSNKGITQESYVISSNIQEFVRKAIVQNPKFPEMKTTQQMELITKYAKELIDSQAATAKIIQMPNPASGGLDPAGNPLPAPAPGSAPAPKPPIQINAGV